MIRQRAEHLVIFARLVEIRKSDGQIFVGCPNCRTVSPLPPDLSEVIRVMALVTVPHKLAEAH